MSWTLSKSDYLLFLKHPAWLWLKKHDKDKLPPVSDNLQAVFDAGHSFEKYVEKLFPGGSYLGFSNYQEYSSLFDRTKKALQDGATTIFQGGFKSKNLHFISDIIVKVDDNTFDLYEIKSATKAKLINEHDLAFQMIVLESCGYKVRNIKVLHANNKYIRDGRVDIKQLVSVTDVTSEVKETCQDSKEHIKNAFKVMEFKDIPDISPSLCAFDSLKDWIEIYKTLTKVEKGSIYDLCRLNVKLISEFDKRNISKIVDITNDIKLGKEQRRQVEANIKQEEFVFKEEIKRFLSKLVYPLYFLDYETMASVVPEFDGLKPYQQLPFQYSLHVLGRPGGDLKHVGYLHQEKSNPVMSLSKSLSENIGESGTVLVWFEGFEKSRNTEMGKMFSEYKEFYKKVNSRVIDLMIPFSNGWYVNKDFLGSASIKKVLPVLVPELSYLDLDVHEGGTAQRVWMETVLEDKHKEERSKIFKNLDEYCKLDTLAMVKIYEKLRKIAS